jgi:cell wall-associated NlpC family hydrolase
VTAAVATVGSVAGAASAATPGSADPIAVTAAALLDARAELAVRADAATDAPDSDNILAESAHHVNALLGLLAAEVGPRSSTDPGALVTAWRSTTDQRLTVVLTALAQVGVPYRWAHRDPGFGFDCSGLTSYAWLAGGLDLPHQSGGQAAILRWDAPGAAQPADIGHEPHHVVLYLGAGPAIVEALHSGAPVMVDARGFHAAFGSPV